MTDAKYTSQHLKLTPTPNGGLTVSITPFGEDLLGGIAYVAWDFKSSCLEIEGTKDAVTAEVPVDGLALFLKPDLTKLVAGQELLEYAPGWRLTQEVMEPSEYLDLTGRKHGR